MYRNSLSFRLRNRILFYKGVFERSRLHFFFCLGAALLGMIIALFGSYGEYQASANFFVLIRVGGFNPVGYPFIIAVLSAAMLVFMMLASMRFFMFLLFGYGSIFLASFLLFRIALISTAIDGILGIVFLMFFILPIFIVNLFCFSLILNTIYDVCGFCYARKRRLTLSWHCGSIFRAIKRNWFFVFIFNLTLWFIQFIFLSFIF